MKPAMLAVGIGTLCAAAAATVRAEAQPPPPPSPPTINAPPPRRPDAGTPLITRAPRPVAVVLEGGLGGLGYFSGAAGVGPAWNVRATGAINDRWAIEGNYVGATNRRPDRDSSLVMTALDGSVRYNILLPSEGFVQPFVTAGVGYAGFAGEGGDGMTMQIPISGGAERLLTRSIKVGARLTWRPTFFDDVGVAPARVHPGADSLTLLAHLGGAF